MEKTKRFWIFTSTAHTYLSWLKKKGYKKLKKGYKSYMDINLTLGRVNQAIRFYIFLTEAAWGIFYIWDAVVFKAS